MLTAVVDAIRGDGELLEGTVQALELEALVVVVPEARRSVISWCPITEQDILVRVVVHVGAVLDVLVGSVLGLGDLGGGVLLVAAGSGLITDDMGSGADDGDEAQEGGDGELHFGWC